MTLTVSRTAATAAKLCACASLVSSELRTAFAIRTWTANVRIAIPQCTVSWAAKIVAFESKGSVALHDTALQVLHLPLPQYPYTLQQLHRRHQQMMWGEVGSVQHSLSKCGPCTRSGLIAGAIGADRLR